MQRLTEYRNNHVSTLFSRPAVLKLDTVANVKKWWKPALLQGKKSKEFKLIVQQMKSIKLWVQSTKLLRLDNKIFFNGLSEYLSSRKAYFCNSVYNFPFCSSLCFVQHGFRNFFDSWYSMAKWLIYSPFSWFQKPNRIALHERDWKGWTIKFLRRCIILCWFFAEYKNKQTNHNKQNKTKQSVQTNPKDIKIKKNKSILKTTMESCQSC